MGEGEAERGVWKVLKPRNLKKRGVVAEGGRGKLVKEVKVILRSFSV